MANDNNKKALAAEEAAYQAGFTAGLHVGGTPQVVKVRKLQRLLQTAIPFLKGKKCRELRRKIDAACRPEAEQIPKEYGAGETEENNLDADERTTAPTTAANPTDINIDDVVENAPTEGTWRGGAQAFPWLTYPPFQPLTYTGQQPTPETLRTALYQSAVPYAGPEPEVETEPDPPEF